MDEVTRMLEQESAVDLARMQGDPAYWLEGIVIDESVGIGAPDVPAWMLADDTVQQIAADEIPF